MTAPAGSPASRRGSRRPRTGPAAATPTPELSEDYRARVVIAADGNSSRLSVAMGLRKRDDRPLGVAVRAYYTSPRHDDDYLEAWLDLWDGDRQLPGYGWIFGMGDGTSNVGLGLLNTSAAFQPHRLPRPAAALARRECRPSGASPRTTGPGRYRGAALPMAFNRTPHYTRGLLLGGRFAAGMVNPFNGEGIAYAHRIRARLAARVDHAGPGPRRPAAERRARPAELPPRALKDAYGGYYALGRTFVKADRPSGAHAVRHAGTGCRAPR
jgi:flavin-dependent dehydrogenase